MSFPTNPDEVANNMSDPGLSGPLPLESWEVGVQRGAFKDEDGRGYLCMADGAYPVSVEVKPSEFPEGYKAKLAANPWATHVEWINH